MNDTEHPNPLPGDWPELELDAEGTQETQETQDTQDTEEKTMAEPKSAQEKASGKEIADAEHYLFSLGHSREDAAKHAARIGHKKVLEHQKAGENPLNEE